MKCNNFQVIGIRDREEKEKVIENQFEKMTENFPNLEKGKAMQVQEAQKVQKMMSPRRPITRHIIIKMPSFKDKEIILKAARQKQEGTYKGALIRLAADVSRETLQSRREWQKIFQVMKTKVLHQDYST